MDIDKYIEKYKLELSRNVYRHRVKLGLSKQALADKAGVNRTTVSNIETMGAPTRLEILFRIAHTLGASPEELLGRWHFVAKEDALEAVGMAYWNEDLSGAMKIINGEEAAENGLRSNQQTGGDRCGKL